MYLQKLGKALLSRCHEPVGETLLNFFSLNTKVKRIDKPLFFDEHSIFTKHGRLSVYANAAPHAKIDGVIEFSLVLMFGMAFHGAQPKTSQLTRGSTSIDKAIELIHLLEGRLEYVKSTQNTSFSRSGNKVVFKGISDGEVEIELGSADQLGLKTVLLSLLTVRHPNHSAEVLLSLVRSEGVGKPMAAQEASNTDHGIAQSECVSYIARQEPGAKITESQSKALWAIGHNKLNADPACLTVISLVQQHGSKMYAARLIREINEDDKGEINKLIGIL